MNVQPYLPACQSCKTFLILFPMAGARQRMSDAGCKRVKSPPGNPTVFLSPDQSVRDRDLNLPFPGCSGSKPDGKWSKPDSSGFYPDTSEFFTDAKGTFPDHSGCFHDPSGCFTDCSGFNHDPSGCLPDHSGLSKDPYFRRFSVYFPKMVGLRCRATFNLGGAAAPPYPQIFSAPRSFDIPMEKGKEV